MNDQNGIKDNILLQYSNHITFKMYISFYTIKA